MCRKAERHAPGGRIQQIKQLALRICRVIRRAIAIHHEAALAADKAQGRLQGARPQHRRAKGGVRSAGWRLSVQKCLNQFHILFILFPSKLLFHFDQSLDGYDLEAMD